MKLILQLIKKISDEELEKGGIMKKLSDLINEYFDIKEGQHLALNPVDEYGDGEFSSYGCEIIRPLAGAVQECTYVIFERDSDGNAKTVDEGTIRVSHPVLDTLANGTEYFINERGDAVPEWEML